MVLAAGFNGCAFLYKKFFLLGPIYVFKQSENRIQEPKKNKIYSFINIAGLSVGIASFVLISLHVKDELSYDQFHEKADRIYRVVYEINRPGSLSNTAMTPAPLGPALLKDYPEVENFTRFSFQEVSMLYGEQNFYEELCYADRHLFEIFTLTLKEGDQGGSTEPAIGFLLRLSCISENPLLSG